MIKTLLNDLKESFIDSYRKVGLHYGIRAARARKLRESLPGLKDVRRNRAILLTDQEITQLVDCVRETTKCEGDVAEVGVFDGGSAKIIATLKGRRPLHLFDTFSGLPPLAAGVDEDRMFREGQFRARRTLEELRLEFAEYGDVYIHKGLFPKETGHFVQDRQFSFVHLDVDIYSSTLQALDFFFPRLRIGGMILSHDYLISAGVRRAFEEFFRSRSNPFIPVSGSQCLVVKCAD